jgi:hypothetical protein
MKKELISTKDISKDLALSHKSIMYMISKYRSDFEIYGDINYEIKKPMKNTTGGRPTKAFILNKKQRILLHLLLSNTKRNKAIKIKLSNLFSEEIDIDI